MNGLKITIIGMGVVFIVLFVLSLILDLFKLIFYKEENIKEERQKVKKNNGIKQNIRTSVSKNGHIRDIVVISAVMATLLKDDERIVNIRRIR